MSQLVLLRYYNTVQLHHVKLHFVKLRARHERNVKERVRICRALFMIDKMQFITTDMCYTCLLS